MILSEIKNTIVTPNDMLIVDEDEWLFSYSGRITVVMPTKQENKIQVIAYSDNNLDIDELRGLAKKINGYLLRNTFDRKAINID